jgi:predicted lipoprotein with Yx(FWY)xxD motif
MKKNLGTGFAAMALIAALAGCAGSPGTTTTTAAPAPTATGTAATSPAATSPAPASTSTPASAADLKTAPSSAGTIVVDANGMSVYFFTKDEKDSGTSTCTGACLTAWPPVLSTAATPSAEGVTGTVGTITTADGAKQLTLNGLPLYYFEKDKNPGDILGQGVNDAWYLASPAGEMIRTAASGY